MDKKIKINLNVLGEEMEVEIRVPIDFENWSDFNQMDYIENILKREINYTWDC